MNAISPSASGRDLAIKQIEGEARILDTDLAERLGFAQPVNIRKLIRRHVAALGELGTLSTVERVKRGNKAAEYYLNRRQALFIVTKSEPAAAIDITVEVVRKFDEYENGGRPAGLPVVFDVNDNAQLLAVIGQVGNALLSEREKFAALTVEKAAVQATVIELAPKAAAWEQIADSSGVLTMSAVAKENGVGPHWLARFLEHEIRWCFRRDRDRRDKGPLIAYQTYVDRGLLAHKLVEFTRRDGSVGQRDEVRVTPAGAAKLSEILQRRWGAA